jgi:hypothetical protein
VLIGQPGREEKAQSFSHDSAFTPSLPQAFHTVQRYFTSGGYFKNPAWDLFH